MSQFMLQNFKRALRGKVKLQPFFEKSHQYSLSGMNIGSGANVAESGEKYVLTLIKKTLQENSTFMPVVFDVGANVGDYAKAVDSIFEGKVSTYAFEPLTHTASLLRDTCRNIASVTIHQTALSNTTGTLTMYSDKAGSPLASVHKRRLDHFEIAFDSAETTPVTTLDTFCQIQVIPKIDFLKLDVEGHELSVLQGASHLLAKKAIQFIQFEFGGANIDSRTYFQDFYYLLKDHYTIYRILSDGLQEITTYNERYEIFLASNFLAIAK